MKPASIIFLILAVLLVGGGFGAMRIAENLAAGEGIELISESDEDTGDYIFTYDYSEDSIDKIVVNVRSADIHIIGGAQKSYIELINFPDGMYEFQCSNRIMQISNNSDISSLNTIMSLAMNFKGVRGIINYYNVMGRDMAVNIYIQDELPVKILDCTTVEGNILAENTNSQTDYNIKIGTGSFNASEVATTSTISVEVGQGEVILTDCSAINFKASVDDGDVTLITSDMNKITAELENGDFVYGYRRDIQYVKCDLFCGVGSVTIDGDNKGGYYEFSNLPTDALYKVTTGKGDITINSNMQPEAEPEPEDTTDGAED